MLNVYACTKEYLRTFVFSLDLYVIKDNRHLKLTQKLNNMNFYIRRATPSDVNEIFELHVHTIQSISHKYYSVEQLASWSERLTQVRYLAAIDEKIVFVACEEYSDRVLGFAQLDQKRCWIDACYVLPDQERQGIGHALLQHLEQEAQQLRITALNLNASLNAHTFYAKAGYVKLQDDVHWFSSGASIPCVLMQKKF